MGNCEPKDVIIQMATNIPKDISEDSKSHITHINCELCLIPQSIFINNIIKLR